MKKILIAVFAMTSILFSACPPEIDPAITINTHPAANTTVTAGNISGSLSVAATVTGGAKLSYQWYSNTTNSNVGGNIIGGATSASFTMPTNLTAGTYYYFCEVRGPGGVEPVRSNVATVTVIITYTVSYNLNGGTGTTPVAQTVNLGSSVTLASGSGLSRSGFSFGGWNTNTGGTGSNYSAGSSFTPTGTITLYARWNETITSSSGIEMVRIPGGSFELGRNLGTGGGSDVTPVSTVTLTGFYMGKYQVTQAQYQLVMGSNPSNFSSNPAAQTAQKTEKAGKKQEGMVKF